MCKYLFVTGGVISGIGKGISAASLGLLLGMRGLKIAPIKCDPYLNTNAGILAPREHGEVFLCDDGSETDLDLGHYARFIGCQVSSRNILTSGTVYKELIEEEEEGKYLGQTVQYIPHVTDKIIGRWTDLGKEADVVLVEIGGTVGDIESMPFLGALRQFKQKNWNDVIVALVAPILWIPTIKEFKTKPLQEAVMTLQSFGLQPEILLCRPVGKDLDQMRNKLLDKIANLTNISREAVFDAPDVPIEQVPLEFYDRHIDDLIIDKFHFNRNGVKIHKYRELVEKYIYAENLPVVEIGVIGKYENCDEAYLSLKEAIYHAGVANGVRTQIRWIQAEKLEQAEDMRGIWKYFDGVHAVIVPGGFDNRGVEGKIKGIKYVREKKIPFLGICLGLQCAVIEFARNVCGLDGANSIEFDPTTPHPVVHFIEGQSQSRKKSGTMRLGAYDCELEKDSLSYRLYKKKTISERHRHRYEINAEYVNQLKEKGFIVCGKNVKDNLVEVMELHNHPYYIGTQYHGEYKSRLGFAHPLFDGLVKAGVEKMKIPIESGM